MNTPHTNGSSNGNGQSGRFHLKKALASLDLAKALNVEKNGKLKVLVIIEGSRYVAQCLQYDFAVHGASLVELRVRLAHVLVSHIVLSHEFSKVPFSVPAAPQCYVDQWEHAKRASETHIDMPAVEPSNLTSWALAVVERADLRVAALAA